MVVVYCLLYPCTGLPMLARGILREEKMGGCICIFFTTIHLTFTVAVHHVQELYTHCRLRFKYILNIKEILQYIVVDR